MWPFTRKSRRRFGIDIGTSAVKIVELEHEGGHFTLTNYGIITGSSFYDNKSRASNAPSGLSISESEVTPLLNRLLAETKIKCDSAVMSIPIFSSFITIMELPEMNQKELDNAIPFEARSYIPVPLSEVVLDWIIIPSNKNSVPESLSAGKRKINILLVAVPKEIISKYQRIAKAANINLLALESESFSLARALVGKDSGTVMLADLGSSNANITIIDDNFIFMSHSADFSGREMTKIIGHSLGVDGARADEIKKTTGVASLGDQKGVAQIISPFVDKLVGEMERMNSLFFKKEGKKIEKVVLTGGGANLPGLADYISRSLGVESSIGNPFSKIKFNSVLEKSFRKELASSLSVAAGLAMRIE